MRTVYLLVLGLQASFAIGAGSDDVRCFGTGDQDLLTLVKHLTNGTNESRIPLLSPSECFPDGTYKFDSQRLIIAHHSSITSQKEELLEFSQRGGRILVSSIKDPEMADWQHTNDPALKIGRHSTGCIIWDSSGEILTNVGLKNREVMQRLDNAISMLKKEGDEIKWGRILHTAEFGPYVGPSMDSPYKEDYDEPRFTDNNSSQPNSVKQKTPEYSIIRQRDLQPLDLRQARERVFERFEVDKKKVRTSSRAIDR